MVCTFRRIRGYISTWKKNKKTTDWNVTMGTVPIVTFSCENVTSGTVPAVTLALSHAGPLVTLARYHASSRLSVHGELDAAHDALVIIQSGGDDVVIDIHQFLRDDVSVYFLQYLLTDQRK